MEMTKKWIDQFNEKCAEFMGGTIQIDGWNFCLTDFGVKYCGYGFFEGFDLKFHSDWNWIMEVVEKIESFIFQEPVPDTYYEVRLVGSVYVYIGSNNGDELITVDDQPSKKQAVIQAIDQFIDWYNEQKKL